ncbi:hypothetical protein [Candidatus Mycolicibacterium alkanivorans]|uniref:Uncharacterized protein n=1 Tax=Candidatus Mycolicibacterium alkanivorans TaxID=2954114 RepID=A0ABS9YVM3_9MYCO|nr:hypothetical protein [Candidatus Mycolicibacterium alkanivorans]MCI4675297.1 hypothetical protein [Candidatus Mycolicibacterium alkanivorans]
MIYHDSIEVATEAPYDPPQYDEAGGELFTTVVVTVAGEVFPLDTEQALDVGAGVVTSRYRMVLAPRVDIPPRIGNQLRLGWGMFGLDPVNPFSYNSGLLVDGTVERHMLRGRLHHYELITKSVLA